MLESRVDMKNEKQPAELTHENATALKQLAVFLEREKKGRPLSLILAQELGWKVDTNGKTL